MKTELTPAALAVISDWIALGVQLVPYIPGRKQPPKGFHWSTAGHRIHDAAEAEGYARLGHNIAFVINSASAAMVDIDCPLPHTIPEYQAVEQIHREAGRPFDRIAYSKLLKDEWKKKPAAEQAETLMAFVNAADECCPPHLVIPSSSGRGLHLYYFVSEPNNFSRPALCIEVFANRRLAYITDWEALAGFFDNAPVPMAEVAEYWTAVDEAFDQTRPLLKKYQELPAPKVRLDRAGRIDNYDYDAFLKRNAKAQSGRNSRLYMWVFRAAQLQDEQGIADAMAWAAGTGLYAGEIKATAQSARQAGMRSPYTPFETRKAANNFEFKIRTY